jgi:GntR family transcriptional regulator/MocR family aminotransferase
MRRDKSGRVPLYVQIRDDLRSRILSGALPTGSRLPSTRTLAGTLSTSRGTVELVFDLLASEGLLEVRAAAGTFVSHAVAGIASRKEHSARRAALPTAEAVLPFQMGVPALDSFPVSLWTRTLAKAVRHVEAHLPYQPACGHPPLRERIAEYVRAARGVKCDADQVFIIAGYQVAIHLISQALLRAGDRVWCEDPGYPRARAVIVAAGISPVDVRVDDDGVDVDHAKRLASRARAALVTAAHQAPLGSTLSLERRLALLSWASAARAWIIEDDYDGTYRYSSRALPSLKSLDADDRVIHVGSFSKVLYPGLRLSYMVVPRRTIEKFESTVASLAPAGSLVEQIAVGKFMEAGHFDRHVAKMRRLYAQRRAALVQALEDQAAGSLRVVPRAGGMHVLAYLERRQSDTAVVRRAREAGLAPAPLSTWRNSPGPPALLLGFTNLAAERVEEAVRRLRAVI